MLDIGRRVSIFYNRDFKGFLTMIREYYKTISINKIYLLLIKETCDIDNKNKVSVFYRNKDINLRRYKIYIRYYNFIKNINIYYNTALLLIF